MQNSSDDGECDEEDSYDSEFESVCSQITYTPSTRHKLSTDCVLKHSKSCPVRFGTEIESYRQTEDFRVLADARDLCVQIQELENDEEYEGDLIEEDSEEHTNLLAAIEQLLYIYCS